MLRSRILAAGNIVGWGGPYSVSFSLIRETGLTLFQEQMNDQVAQGGLEGSRVGRCQPAEPALDRLAEPARRAAARASASSAPGPAVLYHALVCGTVTSGVTVVDNDVMS